MKYALVLISFSSFAQVQSIDCPFGDNHRNRFVDSLKNRFTLPVSYEKVPFDSIASLTLAENYGKCTHAVSVNGYIMRIEDGGSESCNCHSSTHKDTHIYLVRDSSVTANSQAVIVEISPAFRDLIGTTKDVRKKYLHRSVAVSGYLFQDQEHKSNSRVDNGRGNLWRSTVWEIHPVTNIALN